MSNVVKRKLTDKKILLFDNRKELAIWGLCLFVQMISQNVYDQQIIIVIIAILFKKRPGFPQS